MNHQTVRIAAALLILVATTVTAETAGPPVPELPPPGPSTFRLPVTVGWDDGEQPTAPPGFVVRKFMENLDNPRWLYVLPNGDVLVSQSRTERLAGMPDDVIKSLTEQGILGKSANNVLLLRQTGDRVEKHVLVDGLNLPHGMLLLDDHFYVANTDSLVRFPYRRGQTRIDEPGEKILSIPAGETTNLWNNHWTRNIIASTDGKKIYLTVGAGTNANENGIEHPERAAIWEINPDGTGKRLFTTGLRNPVGIDFEPATGDLWTTVNERDGLGADVPPDFLTRVLDGAFYGWPYVYYGTYADPGQLKLFPRKVAAAKKTARVPDLALGGHSVPLGLRFYRGKSFPDKYRHGAFVARRGGVGRAQFLGYDVVYIPFENGLPTGRIEPFMTGFIADPDNSTVHGRPVGLAELPDGSLLVTDDTAHMIWHVSYGGTD